MFILNKKPTTSYRSFVKKVLTHVLGKLAIRSYYCEKISYKLKLHKYLNQFKVPPLLIYQWGKVGSKTVVATLKKSELKMPIYHVHHLTKDYFSRKEAAFKKHFSNGELIKKLEVLWLWKYLRSLVDKDRYSTKWKIIALVRDPVAINISGFFHQFNEIYFDNYQNSYRIKSWYYDYDITVNLDDIDNLKQVFLKKVNHEEPLMFFDTELKKVFGIDIFVGDFPHDRGYKIYEGSIADVLVIRLENLNDCYYEAFKEFLDIEVSSLINDNIGSNKGYGPLYSAFKKSVVLPSFYLNKMYTSEYATHFYRKEEINDLMKRWGSPIGDRRKTC